MISRAEGGQEGLVYGSRAGIRHTSGRPTSETSPPGRDAPDHGGPPDQRHQRQTAWASRTGQHVEPEASLHQVGPPAMERPRASPSGQRPFDRRREDKAGAPSDRPCHSLLQRERHHPA